MTTHDKLVSTLTGEDRRLSRQEVKKGYVENTHRLGIYFQALERAENDPFGISVGINDNFVGRLETKLQKAIAN